MTGFDYKFGADRRTILAGAAVGAAMVASKGMAADADGLADVKKAIAAQHAQSVKRLQDWIALPSIAAEKRAGMEGAEYMKKLALDAGFQHAEIAPTKGQPGVYATMDNRAPKTLGLYFMFDVKQYDPSEWTLGGPLDGKIVDKPGMGKILVGRGATNQKGPEATFLAALHALKAAGRKPPVNFILVAEGEEEVGSTNFRDIVHRPDVVAALSKSVGIFMPSHDQGPTGGVEITLGSKGVIEAQLISSGEKWGRGPGKDVHSSLKATVDSPVWHLVAALRTLVSDDGNTITIPGWYDKVRPLTAHEKELIAANCRDNPEAEVMAQYRVKHWIDDNPYQKAMERLAGQPTINIEGLVSGYTGPGGKTILPGRAEAKLDLRLVPNMTFDDAVAKLRAHLKGKGFGDIEVNVSGGYDPTETAEDSALIKAEVSVYTALGKPPTMIPRSAGSYPGVTFTGPPLKLASSHFGMGYGTGAHAPDEYMLVESTNPAIMGMDDSALAFVQFLNQVAATG